MNFKKKISSVNVPVEKTSLESLVVNRFDLQLAKINTLTEQYTIVSQRLAAMEALQKETFETIKTLFGKVSSLEKVIADTLQGNTRKNDPVIATASTASIQGVSPKKKTGLRINRPEFLGLRSEMRLETFTDFQSFYELCVKPFCKADNWRTWGKKSMQSQAKELWDNEISKLDWNEQEMEESPYLFPEIELIEENKKNSPPSQTEVWSTTMGIEKSLLDKAIPGIRDCTESEIEIDEVMNFLKVKKDHDSIKSFGKWILSLCKKG